MSNYLTVKVADTFTWYKSKPFYYRVVIKVFGLSRIFEDGYGMGFVANQQFKQTDIVKIIA